MADRYLRTVICALVFVIGYFSSNCVIREISLITYSFGFNCRAPSGEQLHKITFKKRVENYAPYFIAICFPILFLQLNFAFTVNRLLHVEWRVIGSIILGLLLAWPYKALFSALMRRFSASALSTDKWTNAHYLLALLFFFSFNSLAMSILGALAIIALMVVFQKITFGDIIKGFLLVLLLFAFFSTAIFYLSSLPSKTGQDLQIPHFYITAFNFTLALFPVGLMIFVGKALSKWPKALVVIGATCITAWHLFYVGHYLETGELVGPITFIHMEWVVLRILLIEYTGKIILIVAALVMMAAVLWRLTRHAGKLPPAFGLLCIGLGLYFGFFFIKNNQNDMHITSPGFAFLHSPLQYVHSNYYEFYKNLQDINVSLEEKQNLERLGISLNSISPPNFTHTGTKPNLILIYLESLQENFTRFKNNQEMPLMPRLSGLPGSPALATNFFASVGPTINALITSLCGVNIYLIDQNQIFNKDGRVLNDFGSKFQCLPDILRHNGYYQSFMMSSPAGFSGIGRFVGLHGYDRVVGANTLKLNAGIKGRTHAWGIDDTAMFDEATAHLESLKTKQPFNLTLMTINSHFPGFQASDCPVYEADKPLLNGIHCIDYATGRFLDQFLKSPLAENTVIVLMSDHHMFTTQQAYRELGAEWLQPKTARKLYLSLYDPYKRLPAKIDTVGYTPDMAPTILELLGFSGPDFISGKSLIGRRKQYSNMLTPSNQIVDGKLYLNADLPPCNKNNATGDRIINVGGLLSKCQLRRAYLATQKVLFGIGNKPAMVGEATAGSQARNVLKSAE